MAVSIISKIKPINGQDFPVIDAIDVAGGYFTCDYFSELESLHKDKRVEGALVYVRHDKAVYQYNGEEWLTFSMGGGQNGIYILDTEPIDKNGLWIDTSESKGYTSSNSVIQDLVNVINILQRKVESLEYIVKQLMDFGDFNNNKEFEGEGIDPDRTSEEEDDEIQAQDSDQEVEPDEQELAGHLCIKSGTYKEMVANKDKFNAKELLFCYDINSLFIKSPLTFELVRIGSSSGDLPDISPDIPDIDDETMAGIISDSSRVQTITWADMANDSNSYVMQIKNGNIQIYNKKLDVKSLLKADQGNADSSGYYSQLYFPISSGNTNSPLIFINSIYCGESNGKYDYCPVSHNFVELSNTGTSDLNLKGLYLHYTEGPSRKWVTLPLWGTLKAGSTFLIKGAQCSVENVNTTKIKVGEPDLVWDKSSTLNPDVLEGTYSVGDDYNTIWDENDLIKFSYNCSFLITAAESTEYFEENVMSGEPFQNYTVYAYYIDMFGSGQDVNSKNMPCETSPFATRGKNILPCRYYNLDGVSQAVKALSARSNATEWCYVDLTTDLIDVTKYTPKASFEGKNIFFNKRLLTPGAPNVLTCTFGFNAHETRCFTWVSEGYYDEYLEYKAQNSAAVTRVESFKEGDGRSDKNNRGHEIYNRIRSITTDGTPFTVHKVILDFPEVKGDVYEYRAGRDGYFTEWRQFTLKKQDETDSAEFSFLHYSDQQGFNGEEYETVRVSNDLIEKSHSFDFIINAGDITQNGNRINEWLDYFKASEQLMKTREHMFSIGNNDLCPLDVYTLGKGKDIDKTNPINANYFFTFEHPFYVPVSSGGVYMPCNYYFMYHNTLFLSVNSEFTSTAQSSIYNDPNIYNTVKDWMEIELSYILKTFTPTYRIAFCHEAPFTIITSDAINSYIANPTSTDRGGSHVNSLGNYFLSDFLERNDFTLCLCGHKHTYSNSRYIIDNPDNRMCPLVYDGNEDPEWLKSYKADTTRYNEKAPLVQHIKEDGLTDGKYLINGESHNFVRYVMTQACGYKLVSNKELPAKGIPWLMNYYPAVANSDGSTKSKNTAQEFPNYIIWTVGQSDATEQPTVKTTTRPIIKGEAKKIGNLKDAKWSYKYTAPVEVDDVKVLDGNGEGTEAGYNIIIENTITNYKSR